MKQPSFFIVGHSKSGTTALSRFLHQHPGLFVCDPEEPNYFCPSLCRADGPPSIFYRRSKDDYLGMFAEATQGQICGEASAVYLYSTEAAALIQEFEPSARIIMIFREPADFLRSYHLQLLKNAYPEGETVRDLGEAIRLEGSRRRGRNLPDGCLVPEMLWYATDRLRYDEHYDRFAALFPDQQIQAFTYDEFRADNLGTVQRVFDFLGVDPTFEPELRNHNVGGMALKSRRAYSALNRATQGRGLIGAVRAAIPRPLRRRLIRVAYDQIAFERAGPVNPELVDEIRERARPHLVALGERMERDLLLEWNYGAEPEPTWPRTPA